MKIVFMGTPHFALESLNALHAAGHEIAVIFTKEDKPRGRGMKMQPSPCKVRGLELNIPVFQPKSLKGTEYFDTLKEINPKVIVVAAYGLILRENILHLPPLGCLNVHASLLPKYRGASPINAAILHGESQSGVTIMQMDKGIDTGDMLLAESVEIGADTTAGQLHDMLAPLGGRLIVEALDLLEKGGITPIPQGDGATHAPMIENHHCKVDFSKDAHLVCNHIRGYDPAPAAWGELVQNKVRLFGARVLETESCNLDYGKIESCDKKGARILCKNGSILLRSIQIAGGKKMDCDAFFRGRPQFLGEKII